MPDSVQVSLFEDRAGRSGSRRPRVTASPCSIPTPTRVTPYSFYERDPGPTALTGVMGIAEDADGNLWLGSPGLGLLRLNPQRDRFHHYGYQPQDVHSIAENKVIALFQDRDGNIWTGLHSAGVNYFGRGSQRFEVFRHIPGDPHSLTLDFVNAIFEDRDGTLWIGNDDGLNRIDRRSGQRKLIDLGLGLKPMVISMAQDHDGAIWLGTFAARAHALRSAHAAVRDLQARSREPAQPQQQRSASRVRGPQGHGMGGHRRRARPFRSCAEGLHGLQAAAGQSAEPELRRHRRGCGGQLVAGYCVLRLASLRSGAMDKSRFIRHKPGDPNGLRDNTVPTVIISRAGMLWIGTQNGLNSLDPRTGEMRAYDTRNGMPANTVACMLEDEQGDIWLSTTKGLSKLTPATGTFANYSLRRGLAGNDLTGWATCSKSRRGELFFAGFAGAVAFVPTALQEARVDGATGADEFRDRWRAGSHRSGTTARACHRLLRTRHPRALATKLLGHVCRPALCRSGGDALPLPSRRTGQHVARVSEQHATSDIHDSPRGPLHAARANGSGPRRLAGAGHLA